MSIIQKAFFSDKWNIGFVYQTVEELIEARKLKPVSWLKEDKTDYSADPFVITHDKGTSIYYEYFSFWEGKGKIYHIDGFDFKTKRIIDGISSKAHLSYPYIFNENCRYYCIPETSQLHEVGLYTIDLDNKFKFEKVHTLLSGAPYVDSSIIKYNGLYWLFTSRKKSPDKLFIFYSDSLEAEFTPHQLNPIPVTAKSTRGAGSLFIHNNTLFRPTQNTIHRYGGSIMINKITALTETEYRSEECFEIHPANPYPEGIHNISISNNLIVVDGKRRVFSGITPFKKFMKNLSGYKGYIRNQYFK